MSVSLGVSYSDDRKLAGIQLAARTKKTFLKLLKLLGENRECEACGTKKKDVLTRHHKIRQSIKKDNSISNLSCLCRDDHDTIEKFYDWIIAFNIPQPLYNKRKELDFKLGRIGGLMPLIKDINKPVSASRYLGLDIDSNFLKSSRSRKIKKLNELKAYYMSQRRLLEAHINNIILESINWNDLYSHALEYTKSKRG